MCMGLVLMATCLVQQILICDAGGGSAEFFIPPPHDPKWNRPYRSVLRLGKYVTPRERATGTGTHGHLFGTANPDDEKTVGAFFIIWQNGKSITAWTGMFSKRSSRNIPIYPLYRWKMIIRVSNGWYSLSKKESIFSDFLWPPSLM